MLTDLNARLDRVEATRYKVRNPSRYTDSQSYYAIERKIEERRRRLDELDNLNSNSYILNDRNSNPLRHSPPKYRQDKKIKSPSVTNNGEK